MDFIFLWQRHGSYASFSKCGTCSAKPWESSPLRGRNEQEWAHNEEVDLLGEAEIPAAYSIKESARGKRVIADIDTCTSRAERMDMSRRSAQPERLQQIKEWGDRPRWAREFLWEVGEGDIGLTALYSLTVKLLPHPSIHLRHEIFCLGNKIRFPLSSKFWLHFRFHQRDKNRNKSGIRFRFCPQIKIWTKFCFCFCFFPHGEIKNSIKKFCNRGNLILLLAQNV